MKISSTFSDLRYGGSSTFRFQFDIDWRFYEAGLGRDSRTHFWFVLNCETGEIVSHDQVSPQERPYIRVPHKGPRILSIWSLSAHDGDDFSVDMHGEEVTSMEPDEAKVRQLIEVIDSCVFRAIAEEVLERVCHPSPKSKGALEEALKEKIDRLNEEQLGSLKKSIDKMLKEVQLAEELTEVGPPKLSVESKPAEISPSPPLNPSFEEVLIPSGTFEMGDKSYSSTRLHKVTLNNSFYWRNAPIHKVTLSRSFYMMDAPITQALYESVMGKNPSEFSGESDSLWRPVEKVNWFDVLKFANRLSDREGLKPAYVLSNPQNGLRCTEYDVEWNREANGYRLPTEAEWEYAARGGEDYKYAGSDSLTKVGWHRRNSRKKTHPVRKKKPNGYGLYDMSGNVFEWCWDWYDDYYYEDGQVDPTGPETGSTRMRRGGSFYSDADGTRVFSRGDSPPARCDRYLGARLLRWQ